MKKLLFTFFALLLVCAPASAACYGTLRGDTLFIGNDVMERLFVWNNGNLITRKVIDKVHGRTLLSGANEPDCYLVNGAATDGRLSTREVDGRGVCASHFLVEVNCRIGTLEVRRQYRIYEGVAAIGCDTYLRGAMASASTQHDVSAADRKNIESTADMATSIKTPTLDRLALQGNHWQTRVVEFFDITDWNDNLTRPQSFIPYRRMGHRGNLLVATNQAHGGTFFFLKEAPTSGSQLAYPGNDFITDFGSFMVTGIGLSAKDIVADGWTRAYSCVLGVAGDDADDALFVLRHYQKQLRLLQADRDEMVMMNTWGDRSQDAKIDEAFCLAELDRAKALGLTVFQLDDGWQTGKSPNSAVAKGSFTDIWKDGTYWSPDARKFPRGLSPIVKKGKKLGIRIGLWYNPSVQDEFADWEKDADALLALYRKYGITIFKIDGVKIETKRAEENLRRLFSKVQNESDGEVVFNLDVTAGRRGGYFMLNEFGNIFLENRYTDWGNYYPYRTLRNLWSLSRYVPAERLQVEFLNKWRNAGKYPDDPFAPGNYSLEYLFAITMVAQPLAWMEASGLPDEAFALRDVVEKYRREVQHPLHQGIIMPIGEEPSGRSWTGFQSIRGSEGYILVFREDSKRDAEALNMYLSPDSQVVFEAVLGSGADFTATVGANGSVRFSLPEKNSYALYCYKTIDK